MSKKEDKSTEQGFYSISKEGVIESIRNQILSREMLISTMFGITIVIAMRVLESFPVILGLILGVFIIYYVLTLRKGKLEGLSLGIYMYYTPDLNRQVIKLKHYDHVGVKQELFSFGVTNIVYLQLLGVLLMNRAFEFGVPVRVVLSVLGVGIYLLLFNRALKGYGHKVERELMYAIEERNQGIHITLTEDEKELIKDLHQIQDSELEGVRNKESPVFSIGYEPEEDEPIKPEETATSQEVIHLGVGLDEVDETVSTDGEESENVRVESGEVHVEAEEEPELVEEEPELVEEEPELGEEESEVVEEQIGELVTVLPYNEGVTDIKTYLRWEDTVQQYEEGSTDILPYKWDIEVPEEGNIVLEEEDDILGLFQVIADVNDTKITNGIGLK